MRRQSHHQPDDANPHWAISQQRAGSALIVVLVVIVILALSAYSFSEYMLAEVQAVGLAGREAQSRAAAESAIELAAAYLGSRAELGEENLYHNPELFSSVVVQDGGSDRSRSCFSLVAPVTKDGSVRQLRFGLIDESSKLNLNAISSFQLDEEQERALLMQLPGMTEQIADAILDWVDEDDEVRAYGAETLEYQGMSPPYSPKNGRMESLEELLLVVGVTPALLYGEDANRNGLLDPNENDGDVTLPPDNADGILQVGWDAYLTVESAESNLRADGSEKIDVNQSLLTELYDQVAEELGEEFATFITAYRMNGAVNVDPTDGAATASTGDADTDDALKKLAEGLASQLARGEAGNVTRGGMDLSKGGTVKLTSLYELVDAEVEASVNGTTTTLVSPWNTSSGDLTNLLATLFDTLTVNTKTTLEGRINVNQARLETLLGIPDMPQETASAIVAAQWDAGAEMMSEEQLLSRSNTGWLLTEGVVEVVTLRKLDKYLTARGDIYRVNAIGHYATGGPVVRLEAVINATKAPPAITFRRDFSHLGSGYRPHELRGTVGN